MSGVEPPRLADPDDWFADESRATAATGGSRIAVDPRVGHDESRISPRAAVAVAIVLLVLVVAALAAAGVFSGGGKHHTTTPPTPRTPTTSRTPTTPTVRHQVPAPTRTLSPGDRGAQVKVLQRALTKLGYPSGPVDGVYGSSTQTALKRFQTASKLTADGVLGPKTLRALKQALHKRA